MAKNVSLSSKKNTDKRRTQFFQAVRTKETGKRKMKSIRSAHHRRTDIRNVLNLSPFTGKILSSLSDERKTNKITI